MNNELIPSNGMSLAAYAQNLDAQLKVCDLLAKSGVLPRTFTTAAQIFAVITMGQEYGFSPLRAPFMFDVIQGRVAPRAVALVAMAQRHGCVIKVVEQTDDMIRMSLQRTMPGGQPYSDTDTYTMADAKLAGLTGKDNWQKFKKDMLYSRCASRLVRRGCADILGGLYASEEVQDFIQVDPTPTEQAEKGIHTFRYDISSADAETKAKIVTYLCNQKAERKDEDIWMTNERLARLDKYYAPVKGADGLPLNAIRTTTPVAETMSSEVITDKDGYAVMVPRDTAEGESIAAEYAKINGARV